MQETLDHADTQEDARRGRRPRVWHLFVLFVLAQVSIVAVLGVTLGFVAASQGQLERGRDIQQQTAILRSVAGSPEVIYVSLISAAVVCIGLALLVGALSPRPFVDRLRLRRGRLSTAELAGASIGFLGLSNAADAILRLLPGYGHSGIAVFYRFFQGRGSVGLWLTILLVGVVAPAGEEIFYRGALQTRLGERFGRRTGLVMASVAFALAHFEPIHMLFALAAGFYLGRVCDLAASCRTSFAVHSINNSVAVAGAALIEANGAFLNAPPIVAASVLFAAASIFWLWRRTADGISGRPPAIVSTNPQPVD